MKKLLPVLGLGVGLLIAPSAADAATRDFPFAFTQDCLSVEGDSLDSDGDGVCDGIDYWRFYTADTDDTNPGAFIESFAIAEFDIDTTVTPPKYTCALQSCVQKTRHNRDWGADRCMQLTAVTLSVSDGSVQESVKSNVGACRDVDKGNPNAPALDPQANVAFERAGSDGSENIAVEPVNDPLLNEEPVAVEEPVVEEPVAVVEEPVVDAAE